MLNKKISTDEFAEKLATLTSALLPQGEVMVEDISRSEGIKKALVFLTGDIASPTVYVDDYWQYFQEQVAKAVDEDDLQTIYRNIADELSTKLLEAISADNISDTRDIVDMLNDFNKARDSIYLSALPMGNEFGPEHLTEHTKDMKFSYILCKRVEGNDATYNVHLTQTHMEKWGVTKQEIYDAAKENMFKSENTVTIMTVAETLGVLLSPGEPTTYVLKGHDLMNTGSSSFVFFDETINLIQERIGESCVVLPSSINELLILPMSALEDFSVDTISKINATVQDINRSIVEPADRLSDHCYIFDADSGEILTDKEYIDKVNEASKKEDINKTQEIGVNEFVDNMIANVNVAQPHM